MSRTLNRSIARAQYAKFAKAWRNDLREHGLYGKAKAPKRPNFAQWYALHQHDLQQTAQSTPSDVLEYLQPGIDPWTQIAHQTVEKPADEGERGVMTINMVGPDDEE